MRKLYLGKLSENMLTVVKESFYIIEAKGQNIDTKRSIWNLHFIRHKRTAQFFFSHHAFLKEQMAKAETLLEHSWNVCALSALSLFILGNLVSWTVQQKTPEMCERYPQ